MIKYDYLVTDQVQSPTTSPFKWDVTPPVVVTLLPPTAGGCICHDWVRPADDTIGGIVLKAVKKAVGWVEEKDGCDSQLKMSQKYTDWKMRNDQFAKPGPKKSCLSIMVQGKRKQLYFTEGRLKIKTEASLANLQLCTWVDCWGIKSLNCPEHRRNMWQITAVGLFQDVQEDQDDDHKDILGDTA